MRQPCRSVLRWTIFIVGFVVCFGSAPLQAAEPKTGTWSGGGAIGFLGNTPDGTAFATNLNADYFVSPQLSLGPLAQIAATGDLFQFGFSGQAKLWFDLPDFDKRLRLNLQGGIGFMHSDLFSSDDSWLIPIGVGLDYAMNEKVSLTSTFLLNFTDIHTSRGNNAHIMPGLTFGVRF